MLACRSSSLTCEFSRSSLQSPSRQRHTWTIGTSSSHAYGGSYRAIPAVGSALLIASRIKVFVGSMLTAGPVGRIMKRLGLCVRGHSLSIQLADDAVPPRIAAAIALRLHERSERKLIRRWLDKTAGTIELGSGFGSITVAIDQHTSGKRIVAVEANGDLADYLSRQFGESPSCTVIHAAVGGGDGTAMFLKDAGILGSHLATDSSEGAIPVPTVSLSQLVAALACPMFNLVCDIEGAEFELIGGATDLLANCRAIVIELHPPEGAQAAALKATLEGAGLRFRERRNDVFAFQRDR